MLELEISSRADSDLQDIWLYIAQDQPTNADCYLDKLLDAVDRLAEFPNIGRELKSFPVGRYNLYYRISGNKLELLRVLSADLDISQILQSEDPGE